MNNILRPLMNLAALLLCIAAFAQPTPPYPVIVSGHVEGCSPANSIVTIQTVQNTQPAITLTVQLDANCNYFMMFDMDSPLGWFEVSTPCQGAVQTGIGSYTVNATDTMYVVVDLNCGGPGLDCEGVPGGPNTIGTSCDDGNPDTFGDIYQPDCTCEGTLPPPCIACFTLAQDSTFIEPVPFALVGSNCSTGGIAPYTYFWTFGDGETSTTENVVHTYAGPGMYEVCLVISDAFTCLTSTCETISIDANGNIDTEPSCQACFYATPASNNPGSNDPIPFTANFNNCSTSGLTPPYAYAWSFDGGLTYTSSVSEPQYTFGVGTTMVCLQFSTSDGCMSTVCDSVVFDAAGTLYPTGIAECSAGYWVIQAYQNVDSTGGNPGGVEPIPNEVWVWNTSTGSGNYQFFWDFGDGASSTEAFPTHVYANGGPYVLCLTMTDDANCTSTFCDSLSIDADGLLEGMIIDGNDHGNSNASDRAGFTLNVIQELPTAINEIGSLDEVALWPNPVSEAITLTLQSSRNSKLELSILDLNGRLISATNNAINTGNNRIILPVSELEDGMYIIRISDGTTAVSRRFVKQ